MIETNRAELSAVSVAIDGFWLRDQHLDVLFRYLYPVCYFVVCMVYWHKLLDE